jgi:hypothetical protein
MPTGMRSLLEALKSRGRQREAMSDPVLFSTLCAMIAVNVVVVVLAVRNANRETRTTGRFRTE